MDDQPNLKYDDLTAFFFEFTCKAEFISEDKEVILMNKVSCIIGKLTKSVLTSFYNVMLQKMELLSGPKAKELIGAPGRRVNNPHLKHYRVFIQNGGAGTRFLKAKSYLLYKNNLKKHSIEEGEFM